MKIRNLFVPARDVKFKFGRHTTRARKYRQKNGIYMAVSWAEIADLQEI